MKQEREGRGHSSAVKAICERARFIYSRAIYPVEKEIRAAGEGQLGHLRQAAPTHARGVFVSFGEAEVSNFDALVSPLLRPRNASSRVTSGIRL